MNNLEWAKKEIELATNNNDGYANMCYMCALELLDIFSNQSHSGYSAGLVKHIFNRLVDIKPLSPLMGTDDEWRFSYTSDKDGIKYYQNVRCSSVFKHVYPNGDEKYQDIDRFVITDITSNTLWHNKFVSGIAEECIGEILFPYMPKTEPYKITVEEISYECGLVGEYDTVHILDVLVDDEHMKIDRYFKEITDENGYHQWEEISSLEWMDRYSEYTQRKMYFKEEK